MDITGAGDDPSKWPQNPLASTASMKRTKKIAQFSPSASSFGTEEGRVSDREDVVMVVMLITVAEENHDGELY